MTVEILLTINGQIQIKIIRFGNDDIRTSLDVINHNRSTIEYNMMQNYYESSFNNKISKIELFDRFSEYFSKGKNKEETDNNLIEFIKELLDSFYMYVKINNKETGEINDLLSVELTITDEYYEEYTEYVETYEGEMYPVTEQIPQQELLFNHSETRKINKE